MKISSRTVVEYFKSPAEAAQWTYVDVKKMYPDRADDPDFCNELLAFANEELPELERKRRAEIESQEQQVGYLKRFSS